MIIIVVQGGLGNQLFQYAYGRMLIALGKEVVFDVDFFKTDTQYTKRNYRLDQFVLSKNITIKERYTKQKFITRLINKLDIDRKVRYVPILRSKDNYVADGYYNTEKYFSSIRKELLSEIVLLNQSEQYKVWEAKIRGAKNPLIVHARRTDFIGSGFTNLDESYYKSALTYFPSNTEIFAFSDDISWLVEVLGRPVTAVSGNGLTDYEEMMLMSLAKNFIIANSTFSWWGAWLSPYEDKKVVAPKKWFKSPWWYRANRDIVPKSWTRI